MIKIKRKINKNAEFNLSQFLKIILTVVLVFVSWTIGATTYNAITGTSSKQAQIEEGFRDFSIIMQTQTLSNRHYSSGEVILFVPERHYVVGFSANTKYANYYKSDEITHTSGVLKTIEKPSARHCRFDQSCFCFYSDEPESSNPNKYLLFCEQINVDFIMAGGLFFNDNIQFIPKQKNILAYRFIDIYQVKFIGKETGGTLYQLFLSNYYNKYRSVDSKLITKNLGFENDESHNFVFHSRVIPSGDLVRIGIDRGSIRHTRLYFEVLKDIEMQKSALIFFPYNDALRNRQSFFIKMQGKDECNNAYLNQAFLNSQTGNYSYCKIENSELVKSEQEIPRCELGKVQFPCVCGHDLNARRIISGYCLYNEDKTESKIYFIPDNLCHENIRTNANCGIYDDQDLFICESNICNINRKCIWNEQNNKCVSQ
jgi:hypothetical protein